MEICANNDFIDEDIGDTDPVTLQKSQSPRSQSTRGSSLTPSTSGESQNSQLSPSSSRDNEDDDDDNNWDDDESQLSVHYDEPTDLYRAIEEEDWKNIKEFLETDEWGRVNCANIMWNSLCGVEPPAKMGAHTQVRTWVGTTTDEDDELCRLPLHAAVFHKAPVDIIEALIKLYRKCVQIPDSDGNYPLHLAFLANAETSVLLLLLKEYPAAINKKNALGCLPDECGMDNDIGELLRMCIQQTRAAVRKEVKRNKKITQEDAKRLNEVSAELSELKKKLAEKPQFETMKDSIMFERNQLSDAISLLAKSVQNLEISEQNYLQLSLDEEKKRTDAVKKELKDGPKDPKELMSSVGKKARNSLGKIKKSSERIITQSIKKRKFRHTQSDTELASMNATETATPEDAVEPTPTTEEEAVVESTPITKISVVESTDAVGSASAPNEAALESTAATKEDADSTATPKEAVVESTLINEADGTGDATRDPSGEAFALNQGEDGGTKKKIEFLKVNANDHVTNLSMQDTQKMALGDVQLDSSTLQRDSSTLQRDSSTLQRDSSTLQRDSSTLQRDSSTLQRDSSTLQRDSSTLQRDSSAGARGFDLNATSESAVPESDEVETNPIKTKALGDLLCDSSVGTEDDDGGVETVFIPSYVETHFSSDGTGDVETVATSGVSGTVETVAASQTKNIKETNLTESVAHFAEEKKSESSEQFAEENIVEHLLIMQKKSDDQLELRDFGSELATEEGSETQQPHSIMISFDEQDEFIKKIVQGREMMEGSSRPFDEQDDFIKKMVEERESKDRSNHALSAIKRHTASMKKHLNPTKKSGEKAVAQEEDEKLAGEEQASSVGEGSSRADSKKSDADEDPLSRIKRHAASFKKHLKPTKKTGEKLSEEQGGEGLSGQEALKVRDDNNEEYGKNSNEEISRKLDAEEGSKKSDAEEGSKKSDAEEGSKKSNAEEVSTKSNAEEGSTKSNAEKGIKKSNAEEGSKESDAEKVREKLDAENGGKESDSAGGSKKLDAEGKLDAENSSAGKGKFGGDAFVPVEGKDSLVGRSPVGMIVTDKDSGRSVPMKSYLDSDGTSPPMAASPERQDIGELVKETIEGGSIADHVSELNDDEYSRTKNYPLSKMIKHTSYIKKHLKPKRHSFGTRSESDEVSIKEEWEELEKKFLVKGIVEKAPSVGEITSLYTITDENKLVIVDEDSHKLIVRETNSPDLSLQQDPSLQQASSNRVIQWESVADPSSQATHSATPTLQPTAPPMVTSFEGQGTGEPVIEGIEKEYIYNGGGDLKDESAGIENHQLPPTIKKRSSFLGRLKPKKATNKGAVPELVTSENCGDGTDNMEIEVEIDVAKSNRKSYTRKMSKLKKRAIHKIKKRMQKKEPPEESGWRELHSGSEGKGVQGSKPVRI